MTYATYNVGTWQDVRQRIRQFAQGLGWATGDYTDGNGDFWEWFTLPGGGPTIEIRDRNDFFHPEFEGLFARVKDDNPVKLGSSICSPLIGTWGSPTKPALSALHCFGLDDPTTPYIAAVVEFASGFFRHLYMGRLHKYGSYTGGTVITSCNWHRGESWDLLNWSFFDETFRRPFSARCQEDENVGQEPGYIGGVHVDVPGSSGPTVRNFEWEGGYGGWWSYYGRWASLGGVGDGVIDHHVSMGNAAIGAVTPMFPINLYAVEDPNSSGSYIVPLGYPVGVRYVNMRFLLPLQQVQVGTDNWRVFPVFKLNKTAWALDSPDNTHWNDETSYIVGLAYKE